MAEYDNREILAEFQRLLEKYAEAERIEEYDQIVFINDILYNLGIAFDNPQYTWSTGFRKFMATVIYPIALSAHQEEKAQFTRKLGMRSE